MAFLYAYSGHTSKLVFNPLHWKGWISPSQITSATVTAACNKGTLPLALVKTQSHEAHCHVSLIHIPTNPVQQGLHIQKPLGKMQLLLLALLTHCFISSCVPKQIPFSAGPQLRKHLSCRVYPHRCPSCFKFWNVHLAFVPYFFLPFAEIFK